MDFFLINKTFNNEEGMVMIVTLMVLMMLTISGVAAINISNNETSIVRNEQLASTEFYDAETGINDARINFNAWMDDAFLTALETTASRTLNTPQATLQIRCIESTVTPVWDFDPNTPEIDPGSIADEIPAMSHRDNPVGLGSDVTQFEIRRYSITSISNNGNTIIQAGVEKMFNKY